MNYLAHLFLADDTPEALVGAMLGDFVKGAAKNNYSPVIQHNIELHRRIDSFTDAHPIVRESKTIMTAERRRYAGVLLDIFYDHFLAQHWSRFSRIALPAFTQNVYAVLHQHHDLLPEKLQRMLPYMKAEDWLGSYARVEWVELTLHRMSQRLTKGAPLASGTSELRTHYERFEADFLRFFPDLCDFVKLRQP
ncbi:MAG TPA: ACP phosphodiesterase [Blastocatellia bacterium]|nr:ACP phosphodiesterase [Blastocatellia bacterium]